MELGRGKNYVIDSDIWPRHILSFSLRWERGYFSDAKVLLGRTQSRLNCHYGPLAPIFIGVWVGWFEHL